MKYVPKLLVSGQEKFVQVQVLNDDDSVPNKVNEACIPAHDATPELIDAVAKDLMRRIADERTPIMQIDAAKVSLSETRLAAVKAVMPLGTPISVTSEDVAQFAIKLDQEGSVKAVAENGEKFVPKESAAIEPVLEPAIIEPEAVAPSVVVDKDYLIKG